MPGILEKRLARDNEDVKDESILAHEEKNEPPVYEDDLKDLNDLQDLMSEESHMVDEKRMRRRNRIGQAILTVACTYLVVLIYGAVITEYRYNDVGTVEPIVLTVSDISNKNEYNNILGIYLQSRALYEKILTFDYRVAAGTEDTMSIAPEYESILDTVSSLATQIEASTTLSKYNQVKGMLLTWVKTHIAAYCQFMSTAITQNDANAANEAIAAREVVNSTFQVITQNVLTLGEDINGIDLTEIMDWSPDGYIQKTIEGVE